MINEENVGYMTIIIGVAWNYHGAFTKVRQNQRWGRNGKKVWTEKKRKEFAPRISVIFPEMSEITIEMASVRIYRDKLVIYQLKVNVI
jgi:hypothetical protein